MKTKDEAIWKAIPLGLLRKLLTSFPDDYLIAVSPVDELLILMPDEAVIGYIALMDEEYQAFEG